MFSQNRTENKLLFKINLPNILWKIVILLCTTLVAFCGHCDVFDRRLLCSLKYWVWIFLSVSWWLNTEYILLQINFHTWKLPRCYLSCVMWRVHCFICSLLAKTITQLHGAVSFKKTNIFWAKQVISCHSMSLTGFYCLHRNPPLFISPSQRYSFKLSYPYFKIPFNIIPHSAHSFSKWSLPFRIPHQIPAWSSLLPHLRHFLCSSHSSRISSP